MSICELILDHHSFEGTVMKCVICFDTGCHDHMFDDQFCLICKEIYGDKLEVQERKCDFVSTRHQYVDRVHVCYECNNHGCSEHIHSVDDRPICDHCFSRRDDQIIQIQTRHCEFYDHSYEGRAYECIECNQIGCQNCILDDAWEERVQDNVFLCGKCYQRQYYNY